MSSSVPPTRTSSRRRLATTLHCALAAALATLGLAVIPSSPAGAIVAGVGINNVVITEGAVAAFTVQLTVPAAGGETVDYLTANDEAVAPDDYVAEADTIVFAPGQTQAIIGINTVGDMIDENAEDLLVLLSNPTGGLSLTDSVGIGTLMDNDAEPYLTIDNVRLNKDSGNRNAKFTVKLFPQSGRRVTVEYHTENGSAISPDDYANQAGVLIFEPGDTAETITVPINGDDINETEEFFSVVLSDAVFAEITDAVGIADITDDALRSQLTIDDVEILEGDHGTRDAVFTVERFAGTGDRVQVEYSTSNDTAVAPGDYESKAGLLVFDPGETTKQIRIKVKGDKLDERRRRLDEDDNDVTDRDDRAGEFFFVDLYNNINADLADDQGRALIRDDDLTPRLTVEDATVKEGDSGSRDMEFEVSLFPASGEEVTVEYTTIDDTAFAPDDYRSESGVLTFEPGEREKTVTVSVKGDRFEKLNESFFMFLDSPWKADIEDAFGEGMIIDDDQDPSISVTDTSVGENSGEASFFVKLSAPSDRPVEFKVSTSGDTAQSPNDYIATGGTLSIAPGETRLQIKVWIVSDKLEENDETFKLGISEVTNAIIADPSGTAIIEDDDHPGAPRVTSVSTSTDEGYWIAASDGDVFNFGDAEYFGSIGFSDGQVNKATLQRPIVAMERTPNDRGYWLVGSDGGVFAYGNARFLGSTGDIKLNSPIVGMARTPSGLGYWLVASDGGIFAFGDAKFYGSTGNLRLNRPIVGMTTTPGGEGYWMVASDGGVFSFGDARFWGSTGRMVLNRPIVDMATTPSGLGYWLVASDGGIFNFGDARFFGSTGNVPLNQPVVGMAATSDGRGYRLLARDGGMFSFGNAGFFGSTGGMRLDR